MTIEIRPLEPRDADELLRFRRQALVEEPFAFLSSPADDRAASAEDVRAQLAAPPGSDIILGALDGETLVGMAGLTRDRPLKAAHRACIWGVFVASGYRRRGIAKGLLTAAIAHARGFDGVDRLYLSVSEKTPAAKRLYESLGFVAWGLEPDCIRYDGESACEYHLSRAL